MNREEKFVSFLESMKKHDPKLVSVIMEGYTSIYEGTFGKSLGMLGLATGIATANPINPDNAVDTTNAIIKDITTEFVDNGSAEKGELINSDNNKSYAELETLVKKMVNQIKVEKDPVKLNELQQTVNVVTRIVDTILDNKLGVLDPTDNLTKIR